MKVVVTGVCGFIGFNLSNHLLKKNIKVYGIDNLDNYYSTKYKNERLKNLKKFKNFKFYKVDISNYEKLYKVFSRIKFDQIIHLAAQAGVRYSFINPKKYIFSNIVGFSNILELSRKLKVKKIIYGSSSSVYGDVKKFPVKENEKCNPISTYSLTKKNNEELAKIYSELYDMKIIGLRFFTVYGQWGRPDMFLFKILKSSLNRKSFKLYNFGDHYRDFTYINDVVDIIFKFMNYKKINNDIFNVSAGKSIKLSLIINELAKYVNLPKIIKVNFQKGDVKKTHGSNRKLKKVLKIKKFIHFKIGLKKTAEWYKANYKKLNL